MSNAGYISVNERPARKNPKPPKKKGLTTGQKIKYVLSVIGTTFLTLFLIIIITICIVAVALTVYITQFAEGMNEVDLKELEISFSSFMYAYDKTVGDYVQVMQLSADENRVWVDFEEIPQYTIDAVIAKEDKRFYEHKGVDWSRTASAMYLTYFDDKMQGGSTITMQLVRDITKDDNVNIGRKLREMFRALSLEQKYSKTDILENYLNRIAFGNTTYGIGSAAKHYFDKDISEVTLAESAILAGVIRSPVSYNPYVNLERCRFWQLETLSLMYDQGYISYSQYEAAKNEKVRFRLPVKGDDFGYVDERYNEYYGIQGDEEDGDDDLYYENSDWEDIIGDPYRWNEYEVTVNWYRDAALKQVISDLKELKGVSEESARDLLKKGGYSIYINEDIEMQAKIEELFKNQYLVRNPDNPYPAGIEAKNTLQAAFVISDYFGNVVALAGGLGDKPGNDCFNRATMSARSIGSTVKPIAVYGPAVEFDRITYSTMMLDLAGQVDDPDNPGKMKYWPQNYEKDYGSGSYMPAWQAVMQSKNSISARTLHLVGPQNSFTFLQEKLGITTLDRTRNLNYSSLATGSLDIKLNELAAAYQIYGNGGVFYRSALYSKVVDSHGKIVLEKDNTGVQAVGKDTAWIVNRMMKKVVEDPSGSGKYAKIDGIEVVGKTGTANDMKNLLFCGLTPDYVGVVRIGYDDGHEIQPYGVDHWRALARIWHDVMAECTPVDKPREFKEEESVLTLNYCTHTGLIAGSNCSSTNIGYYKKDNVPETCDGRHDGSYFVSHPQEPRPYYKS